MTTTTIKYSYASEVAITCGLDGLDTQTAQQSTVVDNTTNRYLDALVQLVLQTTSGTLATVAPCVYVYAYAWSEGQGSHYTDNCTGSDGSFALPGNNERVSLPSNLKTVQAIPYNVAANTVMYSQSFSIAAAFNGILPPKWGIVVYNRTGLVLSGTLGQQVNNIASYVGVYLQGV